jgi:hypothetical protein
MNTVLERLAKPALELKAVDPRFEDRSRMRCVGSATPCISAYEATSIMSLPDRRPARNRSFARLPTYDGTKESFIRGSVISVQVADSLIAIWGNFC